MRRLGTVRPQRLPGSRSTFGPRWPMIPSRSYPAWLGGASVPDQTPTNWTPHGVFVAGKRVHRQAPYGGGWSMAREASPGAWYTPPALWNLSGVADGFLPPALQVPRPGTRKSGTPWIGANPRLVNPFPSVAPPTPALPLPAAWTGRL